MSEKSVRNDFNEVLKVLDNCQFCGVKKGGLSTIVSYLMDKLAKSGKHARIINLDHEGPNVEISVDNNEDTDIIYYGFVGFNASSIFEIMSSLNLFPYGKYEIFLDILKEVNYDINSPIIGERILRNLLYGKINNEQASKWFECVIDLRIMEQDSKYEWSCTKGEVIKINTMIGVKALWGGLHENIDDSENEEWYSNIKIKR